MTTDNKDILTFSKSVYSRKPPKFLLITVLVILIIIISIILASIFIKKSEIITADGIVTSEGIEYISTYSYGNISSIYKKDGDSVYKEDVLIELENDNTTNSDLNNLLTKKDNIEKELEAIDLFVKSIDSKANYLNKDSFPQSEYYEKVEYYLYILKNEEILINSQNVLLERRQKELQTLYKDKELAKGSAELESIETKISTLEEEILSIKSNIDSGSTQSSQIYYQLLIDAETKESDLNEQYSEILNNIEKTESTIDLNKISSPSTGKLHYLVDIKEGNSISQGQIIGSIVPEDSTKYIEVFVQPSDITKIKVKDKCQIEIVGTNTAKYGMITGKISHIDSGTVNKENGQNIVSLYRIEIKPDSDFLQDKENNTIKLEPYMNVSVKIIYEEESYFDWFLEVINFK